MDPANAHRSLVGTVLTTGTQSKRSINTLKSKLANNCPVETAMNRFGSHLNHENLILYEGLPHQGLSETAGQGVFIKFFGHRSATGAPRRGWRHSSYQMDRVKIISASYLNNTIFMGNAQLQTLEGGFTPAAVAPQMR